MTSNSESKLREIATKIDAAGDEKNAESLFALDAQCTSLIDDESGISNAKLWYFKSNVFAYLQEMEDPRSWNWRQPYRERQILYLRRACASADFDNLGPLEREQILTNLASQLSSLGRSIEAIKVFDKALSHEPRFAMALGNRGYALFILASLLHDPGQQATTLYFAHQDFSRVFEDSIWDGQYLDARHNFLSLMQRIESRFDVERIGRHLSLFGGRLGRTKTEQRYRAWAMNHQLFLNPLNAIAPHPIATNDALNLPSHSGDLEDPPHFIAWFNQLKQEYCSARLLLFEHENSPHTHYADRHLSLVDTLNDSAFGISIEKLRISFRVAYGLLDKVAGFVNLYFKLGDNPARVDIRNIWLTKKGDLRNEFVGRTNLPLRGLYWLAFDLTGDTPNDPDAISPDASRLKGIRNALEHRCLILRDGPHGWTSTAIDTITVDQFRHDTFSILRLAQAAITYLAMSMTVEEQSRKDADMALSMPISLPRYIRRR